MVFVRETVMDDWQALRDIRLEALRDAPTETNAHARALYERCGFTLTGERQPLPSDPSIGEVAMSRTLP
jgi:RimJ/RimL family protein N-acetyltransferase